MARYSLPAAPLEISGGTSMPISPSSGTEVDDVEEVDDDVDDPDEGDVRAGTVTVTVGAEDRTSSPAPHPVVTRARPSAQTLRVSRWFMEGPVFDGGHTEPRRASLRGSASGLGLLIVDRELRARGV